MSYDIEVFSVEMPTLEHMPQGRDWQIVADGPLSIDSEDIPTGVRSVLPGVSFVTHFHLEGDAPGAAFKKLLSLARALARGSRGVVVDQQEGTIETPRGVQRLRIGPQREPGGLLQLSWFVHNVEPLVKAAPGALLDLFQRTVPELLPRRYGKFEPPQFKLDVDGLPHFRSFLERHLRDVVVWYCHRPCRCVSLEVPDRVGYTPQGFRCGRLTLDLDGAIVGDPAWCVELTRLWLSVADLVQSFYAEIRLGVCPTKSWWWNGIPDAGALAVLIGDPYIDLWPSFAPGAQTSSEGRLYRERLTVSGNAEPLPTPPATIAQPSDWHREYDASSGELLSALRRNDVPYPEVWPFGVPASKYGA